LDLRVEELAGVWRRLHNEELRNLYVSPNIIRMIWSGHVARMNDTTNACKIWVGKPEGERPPGRPRRR